MVLPVKAARPLWGAEGSFAGLTANVPGAEKEKKNETTTCAVVPL